MAKARRSGNMKSQAKPTATKDDKPIDITDESIVAINTLKGDLRDEILREFKSMAKPWVKMSEYEQERIIHRATDIAGTVVHQAITAIASRGFEHFNVTLGKITVDKGIECKFTLPFSGEAITGLCQRKGDSVILIARDATEFFGEKKPVEAENVGELAIPKTGPGAPSDAAAMEQLGRGPVDGETAHAA